jgi:hypothetical protein
MTWLALALAVERAGGQMEMVGARHSSRLRGATLTAVVAGHTRDVADTPSSATAIKAAARGWADFWDGHLDLDALAVDVTEHLADLQESRARVERFTCHARQWWEHLYGGDPLILSLPGLGPASWSPNGARKS